MSSPRSCCDEFARAAALRAAVPGSGLPAVEAGMPLPAGTGLDRRSFLLRSIGAAVAVYGATAVPWRLLDEGVAAAASSAQNRVLVSIFLEGGIDSISVLFPGSDPLYRRLRPRLALAPDTGTAFAEDPRLRWHPAAGGLSALHAEGRVATLPAVGYTRSDQSHFTSRHFYEVGATSAELRTGWLGRYLDRVGSPDNPLQGLSLGGTLSPALAAARVPVAAIESADEYTFQAPGVEAAMLGRLREALAELARAPTTDPALRRARAVAGQSEALRGALVPFAADRADPGSASYPESRDPFPRRLASLASMLAAGLPIRCVALSAPGQYDTHNDQPTALDRGLRLTSDSLLAFQRDLEARGVADRVLTLVWSEFGRRAQENASRGTDHGAAGIGFLIGSRVRGQLIGEYPGLAGLDENGNLRPTSDFRGLYAAILEQWLETEAGAIIPAAGAFARPSILR
ncbi:MAG: DUF1501 domain-containing protein [Actinobacteria bacterium]|nr:DUF1501 domain-containing protein [Actinomycetota bacterium]